MNDHFPDLPRKFARLAQGQQYAEDAALAGFAFDDDAAVFVDDLGDDRYSNLMNRGQVGWPGRDQAAYSPKMPQMHICSPPSPIFG